MGLLDEAEKALLDEIEHLQKENRRLTVENGNLENKLKEVRDKCEGYLGFLWDEDVARDILEVLDESD